MLSNIRSVIADCSEALVHNNRYMKALMRRAKAYEKEGDLSAALSDVTAVCILEQFENETTLVMTDRILRQHSKLRAKEYIKDREPKLPSSQFIKHYFMSYVRDPLFKTSDGPVDEDKIMALLNNLSLNNPNADDDPRINLLKGTIQILKGDTESAEDFINKVLTATENPSNDDPELIDVRVNALIKLGTLKVQDAQASGSVDQALTFFDQAVQLDPG